MLPFSTSLCLFRGGRGEVQSRNPAERTNAVGDEGFNKVHYYTYSVFLSVFAFLYVGINGRRFLFCHGPLYSIDLFRYLGGRGGGNLMFNGRGVWRLAYAMVRINIKLSINQSIKQSINKPTSLCFQTL